MLNTLFQKVVQYQNRDQALESAMSDLFDMVLDARSTGLSESAIDEEAEKIERTLLKGGLDIHQNEVWKNFRDKYNDFHNNLSLAPLERLPPHTARRIVSTPRMIDAESFGDLVADLKQDSQILKNIYDARLASHWGRDNKDRAVRLLTRGL